MSISDCVPFCSQEAKFCASLLRPDCFTFQNLESKVQPPPIEACLRSSSCNLFCEVKPCSFETSLNVDNPCGGDPIPCLGTVTVYKVHLCGTINILINARVYPVPLQSQGVCALTLSTGGIQNTPSTPTDPIYTCRTVCLKIDQTICVSCSPDIQCPINLIANVFVTNMVLINSGCPAINDILTIEAGVIFEPCT